MFVIRERLRIQGEISGADLAKGRLTGMDPKPRCRVVMMILLNLVNPGYSGQFCFTTPCGRKMLYVSLGDAGGGQHW